MTYYEARPIPKNAHEYARQLARSITDASTIQAHCRNTYGCSPTRKAIQAWIDKHRKPRTWGNHWTGMSDRSIGYTPDNDDGGPWRPRGLVTLSTPKVRKYASGQTYVQREPKVSSRPVEMKPGPRGRAIMEAVADACDVSMSDLLSKRRTRDIVCARKVLYKLLREETWANGDPRWSYPQIASMVGGRDHSTVIYGVRTFEDNAKQWPQMWEAYNKVKEARDADNNAPVA